MRLLGLLGVPRVFGGCLPVDQSDRRKWQWGGRFVLRGYRLKAASNDNVSFLLPFCRVADVADTAHCRRKRRLGLEAGRASAAQWLWVESVGTLIAVEGSQQFQDTPKAMEGLRPVFFARDYRSVKGLIGSRIQAVMAR